MNTALRFHLFIVKRTRGSLEIQFISCLSVLKTLVNRVLYDRPTFSGGIWKHQQDFAVSVRKSTSMVTVSSSVHLS